MVNECRGCPNGSLARVESTSTGSRQTPTCARTALSFVSIGADRVDGVYESRGIQLPVSRLSARMVTTHSHADAALERSHRLASLGGINACSEDREQANR